MLEGSVQRDQNRVRVNAQLVDAETGAHLWAERFEEDVADLFKLQDQVVARLGNALGFELVKAEAGRSVRSKNPDATDLDMRGWALVWQAIPQPMPQKQNTYLAARSLFDQALKIDPDDADALAGEALTYLSSCVLSVERRDGLRGEDHRSGGPGNRSRPADRGGLLREKRVFGDDATRG